MAKDKVIKIGEVEYRFVQPTLAQNSAADFEYSKAYTNALINGLLPRVAMERRLFDGGVWRLEDEQEIETLGQAMREALQASLVEKDTTKKDALVASFYALRQRLFAKTAEKQNLLSHTADSKGDEAKITELIWQCVLKADGSRLWNSRDELLKNGNDQGIADIISEFVAYVTGLDQKISDINDLVNSSYEEEDLPVPENKVETFGADEVHEEKKDPEVVKDEVPAEK